MGTAHKPKSARASRGRSDRNSHKPRRRRPAHSKHTRVAVNSHPKRAKLPDLASILHAFSEALALVSCAYIAVSRRNDYGDEEPVLRMGRVALLKVYDQFDAADRQLGQSQKGGRS
jgi:hypothetical protein